VNARELHAICMTLCFRVSTLYCCGCRPYPSCSESARSKRRASWTVRSMRLPRQSPKAGMQCMDYESQQCRKTISQAISTLGEELATDSKGDRPQFCVAVEGATRNLHPIIRDEIYRIAGEALRNAFRHAHAHKVEVEVRYDGEQFRLRVRDDGRGIDPAVLSRQGSEGHFGLRGMRERATLIGGKLTVWSEVDAGAEVELIVPASSAYTTARRGSWLSNVFAGKAKGDF